MQCPACRKTLPSGDRFCAYCGASLGWQLLPGLSLPWLSLPARWKLTGSLGAVLGLVAGAMLGLAFDNLLLGMLAGSVGLGASAALGEAFGTAVPDRRSAEQFGQALGALGGLLVLPGGLLSGLIISLWGGNPHGGWGVAALLAGGLYLGLICGLGGALVGAAAGVITGGFSGGLGYSLLRRPGAIFGGAVAWTAGAVLGGLFAGDYAGSVIRARRPDSAALGIAVQVIVGALLLPGARRIQKRWRARRRP
jgi:hypothetical protein